MKIKDAKLLVENLLNTNSDNKLLKADIIERYNDLVRLSQNKHSEGLFVYRVIKLLEGQEIKEFKNSESTTTHLSSAASIANEMPDVLMDKSKMVLLDTYYLKFNLKKENILLDIDLILPILKEKLSKHMERYVSTSHEKIKLKEAFERIESAQEHEILADISSLSYDLVKKDKYLSNFSLCVNLRKIEQEIDKFIYPEDLESQFNNFKPILSDKMQKSFLKNINNTNQSLPKKNKINI